MRIELRPTGINQVNKFVTLDITKCAALASIFNSIEYSGFDLARTCIFYRTGKLGSSISLNRAPHIEYFSTDSNTVVRCQCSSRSDINIKILRVCVFNCTTIQRNRCVILKRTHTTTFCALNGATVHDKFRFLAPSSRSNRYTIIAAIFDFSRTAHGKNASLTRVRVHLYACALMCCTIFNGTTAHIKGSFGHIYAAARKIRTAGAAIVDFTAGHRKSTATHIHTTAMRTDGKALNGAATDRQGTAGAFHIDCSAAPCYRTIALNDTFAHTILDFQRAAIRDVKRSLVICRCNGVAVQINAQFFIIDRESAC